MLPAKSFPMESTVVSAILATQALVFNAQTGEERKWMFDDCIFRSFRMKAEVFIFFQEWNTCKASGCGLSLSGAQPGQWVFCLRQRGAFAFVRLERASALPIHCFSPERKQKVHSSLWCKLFYHPGNGVVNALILKCIFLGANRDRG